MCEIHIWESPFFIPKTYKLCKFLLFEKVTSKLRKNESLTRDLIQNKTLFKVVDSITSTILENSKLFKMESRYKKNVLASTEMYFLHYVASFNSLSIPEALKIPINCNIRNSIEFQQCWLFSFFFSLLRMHFSGEEI